MEGLIDPMGRTTKWHRDIQGRVTAKEYVDGSQVRYTYEGTTSRLKTITDEKGQVKLYDYLPDDNVRQVIYLNPENSTPNVTYTYDGPYNRIASMQDGIGTTLYGYFPAFTNGGNLAFVDGPLSNDTVTYDYDELGRIRTRAIGGVAERWDYDQMGRLTTVTNVLGTFRYNYVNGTFRPAVMLYPNGQRTDYAYYDNLGDQRLQTIQNQAPGAQTLSRFDYAYNPAGQITNWLQQVGNAVPENWALGYDAARQLLSATITTNGVGSTSYGYGYDALGNRLLEEIDGVKRSFSYNVLNQIQTAADAGVPPRSYRWDGDNRLVGIVQGTNRHAISYDGKGRHVRIQEWHGSNVAADLSYLWCDDELCESRTAVGGIIVKRFYAEGQQRAGEALFYTRDHLGSVREVTDQQSHLVSLHGYAPFGGRLANDPGESASIGYTGHYLLAGTDLYLTRYRALDPSLGRWLSRDPIGGLGGLNVYAYVGNNPISSTDRLGLSGEGLYGGKNSGDILGDIDRDRRNEIPPGSRCTGGWKMVCEDVGSAWCRGFKKQQACHKVCLGWGW